MVHPLTDLVEESKYVAMAVKHSLYAASGTFAVPAVVAVLPGSAIALLGPPVLSLQVVMLIDATRPVDAAVQLKATVSDPLTTVPADVPPAVMCAAGLVASLADAGRAMNVPAAPTVATARMTLRIMSLLSGFWARAPG